MFPDEVEQSSVDIVVAALEPAAQAAAMETAAGLRGQANFASTCIPDVSKKMDRIFKYVDQRKGEIHRDTGRQRDGRRNGYAAKCHGEEERDGEARRCGCDDCEGYLVTQTNSNKYRTHKNDELRPEHVGQGVRLSGWVHRKRDHGNLLFIDLRDHYGMTQFVFTPDSDAFKAAEAVRLESVISVSGNVIARTDENVNPTLPTGRIEVVADALEVLSAADTLPFQVSGTQEIPEDQRLRYRFLDLRRDKIHGNVVLRSKVISSIRRRMVEQGFLEYQTPILTSSSPEGARDYLVPSRIHPGKFYALPQAPQQFKQLLMVSGFDRYFQIAPCFRDEDARADRSPGEFYQLDLEMSFVEQDDVFGAIEPVLSELFSEFSDWDVTKPPFPRIPYEEAMTAYGSDKPDLRNPIRAVDVTESFRDSGFSVFAKAVAAGNVVRAIVAPRAADKSRSFFDKTVDAGKSLGLAGVAYLVLADEAKGPIAKYLSERHNEPNWRRPPAHKPATRSSLCRNTRRRSASRLMVCAAIWAGSSISSSRTLTSSAGSPISRSTSAIQKRDRSPSVITRFRCRKGAWKRSKRRTRCRSRPTNTTSSVTAWSCRAGPSATTVRTSCFAPSRLRGTVLTRSKSASAAC